MGGIASHRTQTKIFYKEEYLKLWKEFGNSKKMVLSTSFEDVVTSRIERWMYLDGMPYVETFDIRNEKYTLQPNGVETHVLSRSGGT